MTSLACPPMTAEAVIAEAEETVRRAAAREDARARRKALKQRRQEERNRKTAELLEQRRAEEERLRAEAGQALRVLLGRAAELAQACGGSVRDCFAGVPDPRRRRAGGIPFRAS